MNYNIASLINDTTPNTPINWKNDILEKYKEGLRNNIKKTSSQIKKKQYQFIIDNFLNMKTDELPINLRDYFTLIYNMYLSDISKYKQSIFKYSVVTWYNYRKELHAGFRKYFKDYESARIFALNLSKKQMDTSKLNMKEKILIESQTDETSMLSDERVEKIKELEDKTGQCYTIITEDEITDKCGPGNGPYNTLIGYACSHSGYSTEFYCVVDSFQGVENWWNQWDDFEDDSEWIPRYNF